MQARALAKTTRLIVVVTPHAHDEEAMHLRNEIVEFKRRHSTGLIVPVGTRKSLSHQDNPKSTLLTLLGSTTDNICAYDSDSAFEIGSPSSLIVEKLLNDFQELRKASRRTRWIVGVILLLMLLLGLTIGFWRDSEARQRALIVQTARAQIESGADLINEGKGAEAVARFAKAFELTPDDYSARVGLWMAIAERTWILPVDDANTPDSGIEHPIWNSQNRRILPKRSAQPNQNLHHSSRRKRLNLALGEPDSRKLVVEDPQRVRSQEVLFHEEVADADSTTNGDWICVVLRSGKLLRLQWVNSVWEQHEDGMLHDSKRQLAGENTNHEPEEAPMKESASVSIAISPNNSVCRIIGSNHESEFVISRILAWSVENGHHSELNPKRADQGGQDLRASQDDERQESLFGTLHSVGWSNDGRYEMLALEASFGCSTGQEAEVSIVMADTESLTYLVTADSFSANEGYSMASNEDAGLFMWVASRGGAWKCKKPFSSDLDIRSPDPLHLLTEAEFPTPQLKPYVESTWLITDFATQEVLPCIYYEGGTVTNPWVKGLQEARWGTKWQDRMLCKFIKSAALSSPALGDDLNDFFHGEENLEDAKASSNNGQITLSCFIAGRSREVKIASKDGSYIQARTNDIFSSERDVLKGLGFVDHSGDVFWLIVDDKKDGAGEARITYFDRKAGKRLSGSLNFRPRLPSSQAVLSKYQVSAIVAIAHQIAGCRVSETGSIEPVKADPLQRFVLPEDWALLFSEFVK